MKQQVRYRMATLTTGVVLAFINSSIGQTLPSVGPMNPRTPSYDRRTNGLVAAQITAERQVAAAALQSRLKMLRVDYDPVTATPAWISRMGFLTRPTDEEIQRTGDLGLAKDDPHRAIKAFLIENAALFGHGSEVLTNAEITRDYVTPHNGMRTVVWQQELDGIPVFEGMLIGNVTQPGRLVNISSHFLPEVEKAAELQSLTRLRMESAPPISAPQALAIALRDLGQTNEVGAITVARPSSPTPEKRQALSAPDLFGETRAQLVWLPMSRFAVRLCWSLEFIQRSKFEGFQTLVDAASGELLVRRNLTSNFTSASYRVYTSDSPAPLSPGWATPSSSQPQVVSRDLVTLPALSQTASPQGWIRDTDNLTLGNNVDASVNRDAYYPSPTPRPQGSPSRVFDFPLDLSQDPATYQDAAVVNLFYWCNWMHDKLYVMGFTEPAGNFQDDNFGRGGVPGDRMIAYAQLGANRNYANDSVFVPAPDGSSGVIGMFIWNGPTPNRDSDLDAEAILHEYTHGLSSRLVGGGVGISQLQTVGMGDGWSDFYALSLLSQSGDDANGSYPMEGYVSYEDLSMTENYYYGLRRYPCSTSLAMNPLTFKDIDPTQADYCASVAPLSPLWLAQYNSCVQIPVDDTHNIGEVWSVILWDARASLISRYGAASGNAVMLQLVTDGMKLCPPNPTFTQARDAILLADAVNNCGYDWSLLWTAFAKRGLGWYAVAPDSFWTVGVEESYVIAPMTGNPCD
jgi:hypothetical protein